jgi:hypothetical protein
MRSPSLTAAALLGTALLAAGCASTVTGTATGSTPELPPAPAPESAGLPTVDLDTTATNELYVSDVAARPDGGFVVLLIADSGSEAGSSLVEVVPGDGGLTVGATTGAPLLDHPSEVLVAPDGSVVVLGTVPPGAGDPSGDGAEGSDLVLAVPGPDGQLELRPVAADPELGSPESAEGVLSADGTTLYAALRWTVDGRIVGRLATIDVATGAVTATAPLGVGAPGAAITFDVALRPDGGVAALVTADLEAPGDVQGTLVAEFDAQLRPVRPPVPLADGAESTGYALTVLPDGTVVVSLTTPDEPDASWLVTVRGDLVQPAVQLPGVALDLTLAPDGRHVLASYTRPFDLTEPGATLATVDLVSGELVDELILCPTGVSGPIATATGGQAVLATASCTDGSKEEDPAYLVG